jgi:LPS sulfotransferase NodH
MIAAVPRSGSTLLCTTLWESGVLGAPLEYLNFGFMTHVPRWSRALCRPTEYWEELQKVRTSPNGVFSYKMFSSNYKRIGELSQDLLARIAPTHVVYITRANLSPIQKRCRAAHGSPMSKDKARLPTPMNIFESAESSCDAK